MGILGWVKLGFGAREAFRQWREHVRSKKRRKLRDKGKSDVAAKAIVDAEEEDVNLIWNIGKGAMRHTLTTLGGVLASQGLVSQDEVNSAVGALMVLVGFTFSVVRKWMRHKRTGSAD